MKKFISIFLALGILFPLVSLAAEFRSDDSPTVRAGDVVADDLYIAGGTVTVTGDVQGDAVAAGGTVSVDGNVSQDVIVAGGNVAIRSTVGDDIRAAGGTVLVNAKVTGDVIAAGGQVTIAGPGIGGDVAGGGGDVTITAPIGGDVTLGGGNVRIDSDIAGNVKVEAGTLTLGPAANIHGTLTYTAEKEVTKEAGATVVGVTNFTPRVGKQEAPLVMSVIPVIMGFLILLVAAFVVGLVCKKCVAEIISLVSRNTLGMLGYGFVTLIVLPIASIILLVTVLGIPFGMLGLLTFAGLMLTSWVMAPIMLGTLLWKPIAKQNDIEITWKTILLGVVVFYIVGFIPLVGGVVTFFLMLLMLGAIGVSVWHMIKGMR
ncbi:MAG: carbohydrate-binding domain-containing protein [Candidatus Yonathbacteria bacterium]|nr:carbohydrate-binding domain-containing protein [Candidatus Yonathbacteria bacterium]